MRRTAHFLLRLALVAFPLAGCDRGNTGTPTPTSNVSTDTGAQNPTTVPTTRPAAVLQIDNEPVSFPAAKLVITKKAGGLSAILCSDDPPAAIEPNYKGNSFMLEMKLDIEDPADLPTATWIFKAPKREPQDSPSGIFLNGARRQMQPVDVKVTFEKSGDDVIANVSGEFLSFEPREATSPNTNVKVAGKLDATVHEQ